MDRKVLRLAFVLEYLVALVAIFTAWSEIGGQSALDLMHWGWKLGFSLLLAGTIVAYTSSIVAADSLWTMQSARWLSAIALLLTGMAVVTYFYSLQVDTGESDDSNTASLRVTVPAVVVPELVVVPA